MIEKGPAAGKKLHYREAWMYCLTLSYNGHKDWRMPSYFETNYGWNERDVMNPNLESPYQYSIIPVRDIDD
jgi:hypothetical protein